MSEPASVTYVSTEDLLVAGERLLGGKLPVRDWGLLEAALDWRSPPAIRSWMATSDSR